MSNTVPTPITDKNGKNTTVHKKIGNSPASDRVKNLTAQPAPSTLPAQGYLSDGTHYASYGDVKLFENTDYVSRTSKTVSNVSYAIGRESGVDFFIDKKLHEDYVTESSIVPFFTKIERNIEGITTRSAAYEIPLTDYLSEMDDDLGEVKRPILDAFFYGRFGGELESFEGKDFLVIPIGTQNHDFLDVVTGDTYNDESIYGTSQYSPEARNFTKDLSFGEYGDFQKDLKKRFGKAS